VRELERGTEIAWKHAYSSRSILARLPHSPAPWGVRLTTNLGYRFYANHLNKFYNCDWIIGRSDRMTSAQTDPRPTLTLPEAQ